MNPENFIPALTICLMCTIGVVYSELYRWAILCFAVTSIFVGLVSGYWHLFGFIALVLLALHSGSGAIERIERLSIWGVEGVAGGQNFWSLIGCWSLFSLELSGIVWLIANLPK